MRSHLNRTVVAVLVCIAWPVAGRGCGGPTDVAASDRTGEATTMGAREGRSSPPSESVDGGPEGLTKEEIRSTIRGHLHEVRSCYEAALDASPRLKLEVMVRLRIGPSGRVEDALVQGAELPSLRECIRRVALSWSFPRPRNHGIVVVSYPFALSPSSAKGPAPRR
jgi:hypothetical protein